MLNQPLQHHLAYPSPHAESGRAVSLSLLGVARRQEGASVSIKVEEAPSTHPAVCWGSHCWQWPDTACSMRLRQGERSCSLGSSLMPCTYMTSICMQRVHSMA